MTSSNVAVFPPGGHPVADPRVFTEICTLLPDEPPKDAKVCCVIVVWRWSESMKTVGNALPSHRICDCEVKPVPFAVSRTDSELPAIAPGESEVSWAMGCVFWQLL